MAITVTDLYRKHVSCFSSRLPKLEAVGGVFEPARLEMSRLAEESKALNKRKGIVILSASGMCDAGRIRHHLKHRLWRKENHIVIVGFQAHESLGRRLVDGVHDVRMMFFNDPATTEIYTLGGYSAHAAQSSLQAWIQAVAGQDTQVVLNHGEDDSRAALAACIEPDLTLAPMQPMPGDWIELPGGPKRGAILHLGGTERAGAQQESAHSKANA
jgi:metallo-beta-lactamase family protein